MMSQVVFIASDHAGFALKKELIAWLENTALLDPKTQKRTGVILRDLGCESTQDVDYPIYAHKLARALLAEKAAGRIAQGILICGSGLGMAMVINKYPSLRGAACYNPELGRLAKAHNNAQVLCLGARHITYEEAQAIVLAFFNTHFDGHRHQKRLQQFHPKDLWPGCVTSTYEKQTP